MVHGIRVSDNTTNNMITANNIRNSGSDNGVKFETLTTGSSFNIVTANMVSNSSLSAWDPGNILLSGKVSYNSICGNVLHENNTSGIVTKSGQNSNNLISSNLIYKSSGFGSEMGIKIVNTTDSYNELFGNYVLGAGFSLGSGFSNRIASNGTNTIYLQKEKINTDRHTSGSPIQATTPRSYIFLQSLH